MQGTGEQSEASGGLTADDLPEIFRITDLLSLRGQRRTVRWTRAQLSSAVVSALAAALGSGAGRWHSLADWIAVASFGLTLAASLYLSGGDDQLLWYDGRAAAESIRSLSWRYAMRAAPFVQAMGTQETFDDRVEAVLDQLPGLSAPIAASGYPNGSLGNRTLTPQLAALRAASLAKRRNAYVVGRIDDQIGWYRRRAAQAERQGRIIGWVIIVASVAGLGFGLARALGGPDADLLGVMSAAVAAATAWSQLRQHWPLAAAYRVAAAELQDVRAIADTVPEADDQAWADFCENAENAVSREHTMWHVKRV